MNKAVSELYLANQVTLTRPLTKIINLAIFFSNCKVNISLQNCLSIWMRDSKNGFRRPSMLYPFISCFSIFNDVRTMLLYLTPYDWYIYRCETRPFRLKFPLLLFFTPTTASAQFETYHLQFTRKTWENRTCLFS